MTVRLEKVRLELEDAFSGRALGAAGAAKTLGNALDGAGRQSRGFSSAMDRNASSLDSMSGRLGLATRAVGALGPALIPVATASVGVLAGLAAQAASVALGAGVMVTEFQGVGDALEAVNKAALEPTAENLNAAREAMAQLAPEARKAVRAMQEWRPLLDGIQESAASGFFPGFVDGLERLQVLAPQVESIFGRVGDAAGDIFSDIATGLTSSEGREFITWVEQSAAPTLRVFGETAGNVASGLGDLAMALGPVGGDFNRGLLAASEPFASWADGLTATEGYREFIDYVRETGPQVLDTVGSLADALLQIGEAAAPMAGPLLAALEGIADAVAAIADSPLGPPIMAAVTAMSALNLATRAFGATAATSWATAARGAQGYVAQVSAAKRAAGVGGLLAGGAALSAAGINPTYTMLGAMAGSVIPGIGTAAGAATGALLDLAAAFQANADAARDFDEAIDSGDPDAIRAALEKKVQELEDYRSSFSFQKLWDKFGGGRSFGLSGGSGDQTGEKEGDLAAGKRALADALEKEAQAAGFASAAHREHSDALRDAADLTLAAYDAAFAYEDALRRMREETKGVSGAFKKNGDLVHNLTAEQQEAAESLMVTGRAWADLTAAERKARGGTKANREEWVKTAIQLGWGADEAKRYAKQLFNIPPNRKTEVELKIAEARAQLADLVTLLGQVKSKSITVTATVRQSGLAAANMDYLHNYLTKADGGSIFRRAAMGSTVPHDRFQYGDRYPYLLAPGEEVISNRYGQADQWRPLLKAINSNTLTRQGMSYATRDRYMSPVAASGESAALATQVSRMAAQVAALRRELPMAVVESGRLFGDKVNGAADRSRRGVGIG